MDLKRELQNFSYIDLKSVTENGEDLPENIKNSIVLYNKALDNLYSRSEDIAIIELKKAVSLNPEFYEAMNLLGVCYTFIQDHKNAAEMFEKVMKAQKSSNNTQSLLNTMETAKCYVSENKAKELKTTREGKKAADTGTSYISGETRDTYFLKLLKKVRGLTGRDAVKLFVGFAVGALLVLLLSLAFYPRNTSAPVSITEDDHKKIITH
jgi:tetratricopeptide (TPR) repeat protein